LNEAIRLAEEIPASRGRNAPWLATPSPKSTLRSADRNEKQEPPHVEHHRSRLPSLRISLDADTEIELSTDGDVLVVTPLRDSKRRSRVAELVAEDDLRGRVPSREADPKALYELVDGVATGSVAKAEVAVFLRQNARGR
jgi:hypothetical protein